MASIPGWAPVNGSELEPLTDEVVDASEPVNGSADDPLPVDPDAAATSGASVVLVEVDEAGSVVEVVVVDVDVVDVDVDVDVEVDVEVDVDVEVVDVEVDDVVVVDVPQSAITVRIPML